MKRHTCTAAAGQRGAQRLDQERRKLVQRSLLLVQRSFLHVCSTEGKHFHTVIQLGEGRERRSHCGLPLTSSTAGHCHSCSGPQSALAHTWRTMRSRPLIASDAPPSAVTACCLARSRASTQAPSLCAAAAPAAIAAAAFACFLARSCCCRCRCCSTAALLATVAGANGCGASPCATSLSTSSRQTYSLSLPLSLLLSLLLL
jgi:hypothetical protein